jgi:hypothetical protein
MDLYSMIVTIVIYFNYTIVLYFTSPGTMSLSPDVTPFVPRQQSVVHSQQTNVSPSPSWKLSADVAEFVPSWLNNANTQTSSNATATRNTKPLMTVTPGTTGTVSKY